MTPRPNLHPCLTCPLPDCDDSSRRCGLRVAANEYSRRRKAGERIPEGLRAQYTIAYAELYAPRRNAKRRKVPA